MSGWCRDMYNISCRVKTQRINYQGAVKKNENTRRRNGASYTEVAGCRGRTTEPSKSPEWEMLAATVENFGQYNLSGTRSAYWRDYHGPQQAAKEKEPE